MIDKVKGLRAEIARLNSLLKVETDELAAIKSQCKHDFGITDDEWSRLILQSESESHSAECSKCGRVETRIRSPFPFGDPSWRGGQ